MASSRTSSGWPEGTVALQTHQHDKHAQQQAQHVAPPRDPRVTSLATQLVTARQQNQMAFNGFPSPRWRMPAGDGFFVTLPGYEHCTSTETTCTWKETGSRRERLPVRDRCCSANQRPTDQPRLVPRGQSRVFQHVGHLLQIGDQRLAFRASGFAVAGPAAQAAGRGVRIQARGVVGGLVARQAPQPWAPSSLAVAVSTHCFVQPQEARGLLESRVSPLAPGPW